MAPPQGHLRVSRYFAVLALVLVGLYALIALGGPKAWGDKFSPRLGLDLQGGTTVTLRAAQPNGKAPAADQLELARQIIENRVNGTGVAEAEVVTEGNSNIVVNVPGQNNDDVKRIGDPAQLRFREVLATIGDVGAASAAPSPSASPSASTSPKPSGSATPSPTPSRSASATPQAAGEGGAPTPSGSASASPTPSSSAKPPADASTAPAGVTQAQVLKKFDPRAAQVVAQGTAEQFAQAVSNPELAALFAPVKKLTPAEIAVLPIDWQFKVPFVTCTMLDNRPAGSVDAVGQEVVACDADAKVKYRLAKAAVVGTDVDTADFAFDNSEGWTVNIKFTGSGQDKWTELTRKTVNKQVAVVLDNEVVSAPTIQSVISGDAQVTGQFTKAEAKELANKLKYGALPLTFTVEEATSISPTLGIEQLKAGMLAGGIGLALVVVYCFFYYRALGFVTLASLVMSAAIIYAAVVLLGRQIGFTLTLAGVAGFIVAVGITADSFVVFFERLKDEVKDGRSVRSAVPRAWARARRTILSADAVSFLAAAVLYILTVGAVKGFAFTLGLSTLVDVFIVFFFTHPLVALLSRSARFGSPRFSGLGAVRGDAPVVAPPPGRRRATPRATPKES